MIPLSWRLITLLSAFFICVQAAKRSAGADVAVHNNRLRSKTLSSLTKELKKQQSSVLENLLEDSPKLFRIERANVPASQFVASIYRKVAISSPWKFVRDITFHHSTMSALLLPRASDGNQHMQKAISELGTIISRETYGMEPFGYPLNMEALSEADPVMSQIPHRNLILGYQLSLSSLPTQPICTIQRLNPHQTLAAILVDSINNKLLRGMHQSVEDTIHDLFHSRGVDSAAASTGSCLQQRADDSWTTQLDRRLKSLAADPLPPIRLIELTTDGGLVSVPLSGSNNLQLVGGGAVIRLHFGADPTAVPLRVDKVVRTKLTHDAVVAQLSRHALNTHSPRKLHKLKVKALIGSQEELKRTSTMEVPTALAQPQDETRGNASEKTFSLAVRFSPFYQLSSIPFADKLSTLEAELSASVMGLAVARYVVSHLSAGTDMSCRLVIRSDSRPTINALRTLKPKSPSQFADTSSQNTFRGRLRQQMATLSSWFEHRSVTVDPRWIPSHPEKRHHSPLQWSDEDIVAWKADRLATLSLLSAVEALSSSESPSSKQRKSTRSSLNDDDESRFINQWEADIAADHVLVASLNDIIGGLDGMV